VQTCFLFTLRSVARGTTLARSSTAESQQVAF
jgi:hypothetical protein